MKSERVLKKNNKIHIDECDDYKKFIEKKEKGKDNNNDEEEIRSEILDNFIRSENLHNDIVIIRRRFNDVVNNLNRLVRTENLLNRRRNIPQENHLPSIFMLRNDINESSSEDSYFDHDPFLDLSLSSSSIEDYSDDDL